MQRISKIILFVGFLISVLILASSCGGAQAVVNQSTTSPKIIQININGDTEVYIGLTRQFKATAVFENGSNSEVTSKVTWASSQTTVATISTAGGANAFNPGVTEITATLEGIVSQPFELKVVGARCLEIVPYELPNVTLGGILQMQARLMKSDGTYSYVFPETWKSSNVDIATISSTGLILGLKSGTTNISSYYLGFESQPTPLTVVDFSSITVTPSLPNDPKVGSKMQFTATIVYPDGTTKDVTTEADWRSSNLQVAAFASSGEIIAENTGYTTVQAVFDGICSSPVSLSVVN